MESLCVVFLASTLPPITSRDLSREALAWHVCCSFPFFSKSSSQLPRRMMMMAELVQGQASVAQPGTKDDFADTIRRVRQVNVPQRTAV